MAQWLFSRGGHFEGYYCSVMRDGNIWAQLQLSRETYIYIDIVIIVMARFKIIYT